MNSVVVHITPNGKFALENGHSILPQIWLGTVIYQLWTWRPSWSCDHDCLEEFSFPRPMVAPHKIWLQFTLWLLKRSCLKMLTDDGRTTDTHLYYKLTNEPSENRKKANWQIVNNKYKIKDFDQYISLKFIKSTHTKLGSDIRIVHCLYI